MSKKVVYPLLAIFTIGLAAGSVGCKAEAKASMGEPKAATPPPPPPDPPKPPDPPPAPPPENKVALKPVGKAKIEGNEIKIPGQVHFELNKATIKEDKETKEILDTLVSVMKENKQINKLRIEGHTDDKGTSEHNHKLSNDRAQAIADWLGKNGVEKDRIVIAGYGEDVAIADNATKEGAEKNRRVEFKLWEVDGKPTDYQSKAPPVKDIAAAKADDKKGAAKPGEKTGTTPPKK